MQANTWRGEVDIVFDKKTYVMRPTFIALNNIEQELNTGFIDIVRKISSGRITLEELSIIIAHCLIDSEALNSPGALKEAIIRNGLAECMDSVVKLCTAILEGFSYHE